MAIKTHNNWESRSWRHISLHPCERANYINMHFCHGKIAFLCLRLRFSTIPTPADYTTLRKYTIDLGNEIPQGQVMGWNINPINPQTPTQIVVIPTRVRATSTGGNTEIWHWSKGISDGLINWWHHNHLHWCPKMGRAWQKRSITGNPHHIQSTIVLRTTDIEWTPFTPQTIIRRLYWWAKYMSGLVDTNLLSTVISTQRKRTNLGTGYQGIPITDRNKYWQYGIPHWHAQSCQTYHPPIMVIIY